MTENKPTYEELVLRNQKLASMIANARQVQMAELKEDLIRAYNLGVDSLHEANETTTEEMVEQVKASCPYKGFF